MSVRRVLADEKARTLSKDDIYSMLSNRRRRLVLDYLRETEETVSVRDLSRAVAAMENGIDREELTYKQRKRVYTSLHQTHLPKLDDVGVVVYDRDRGTISLTPLADELDSFLDGTTDRRVSSWSVYYLGLSGLSMLVVALAWSGLFPFSLVPDIGYAFLVAVGFAASSSLQVYAERAASEDGERSLSTFLPDVGLRDDD